MFVCRFVGLSVCTRNLIGGFKWAQRANVRPASLATMLKHPPSIVCGILHCYVKQVLIGEPERAKPNGSVGKNFCRDICLSVRL